MTCEHGYEGETTVMDDAERSACCGAFVTFTGDGYLCCKCCYAEVTGGETLEGFEVAL